MLEAQATASTIVTADLSDDTLRTAATQEHMTRKGDASIQDRILTDGKNNGLSTTENSPLRKTSRPKLLTSVFHPTTIHSWTALTTVQNIKMKGYKQPYRPLDVHFPLPNLFFFKSPM